MSICTVDTMPVALTLGIGSLGHDSEKVSLELLIEPLRTRQERETRQILYCRWDGASIRPDNRSVLDLLDQGPGPLIIPMSFDSMHLSCNCFRVATFRTLQIRAGTLFSSFFRPSVNQLL